MRKYVELLLHSYGNRSLLDLMNDVYIREQFPRDIQLRKDIVKAREVIQSPIMAAVPVFKILEIRRIYYRIIQRALWLIRYVSRRLVIVIRNPSVFYIRSSFA